jgi:exopolysaccharide production protein ExoZ
MRFQGIQILRFFCAAGVVVFHAVAFMHEQSAEWILVPWDQLANFGVLFFFAISGFVLTQALQKETVSRYLVLRILRIYPPFLCAIAIVTLFRLAYGIQVSQPQSWFGYLLLLPDGIGPAGFALGGVEWTLKHEVFYYVLLALLWYWRRPNLVKIFLATWAVAILALSIYEPALATHSFPSPRLFLFSATHLAFIAGAYAYLYRERIRIGATHAGLMMVALVGGYEFFQHTETKYLCIALAAFLALTKIAAIEVDERRPLNRVLIGFGDGSYGLYLVHLSVQVILLPNLIGQRNPLPFAFLILLFTSLSIGLIYGSLEANWYRWARRKVTFGRAVPAQKASAGLSDFPALPQAADEAH